jgi:ATP-dependent Clp protease ATP-binding subunit ClpB
VDDTILFHSLDESHLGRIVDIQLDQVIRRVAAQHIHLRVNDLARKRLAEEGYDPQFGARPLKRAIQDLMLNPLAQRLLAGDFKPRDTVSVSVTAAGDLEFTASEAGQV